MAIELAFDEVRAWLQNQPDNTPDTPYEIEVTGITIENYTRLTNQVYVFDKYVDLRATRFPDGITAFDGIFNANISLVYPPQFPDSGESFANAFTNCDALKEVKFSRNMNTAVYACNGCTSLTSATISINKIADRNYSFMKGMFLGCTALTTVNVEQADCSALFYDTNSEMFENCTNLTNFNCDTVYDFKNWLTAVYEISTDNFPNDPETCTYRPYSEVVEVPFSDLNNELSAWSANTTSTPYKLNVTELTVSDLGSSSTSGTLGNVIKTNNTKYVDLVETNLPSITSMNNVFYQCTTLVASPRIPSSVKNMVGCFNGCTTLETAPEIPSFVTNIIDCFQHCESITTTPVIPNTVTQMANSFAYCTSLETIQNISDSVTDLENCFYGCTSLTDVPELPESVTKMAYCFMNCTGIEIVPNIPKRVANITSCFNGCTSLEEITLLESDLESLVTNNKAQNCFYGCTSLTKIGVKDAPPAEASDWNIFRLKFDSNSVQGKVYHRDGTSHNIAQTSITKADLQLPILTDELWFPNTQTDVQIEATIAKMIQYRYGVFNKEVIAPNQRTFVFQADNPDHFQTNLPIKPVDSVTSGEQRPVTSNAVANGGSTIINNLTTGSSDPQDADYYVAQYVGGGTTTTSYHRRPHSALWNYIKGKISSVLGLTVSSYGGNSASATNGVFGRLGGANVSDKNNIPDLIAEISNSSGGGGLCGGSILLSSASKGVPSGWWNFLYIPHRTGTGGGDNYKYGTLLMFNMTSNSKVFYVIHHYSATIQDAISYTNEVIGAKSANGCWGMTDPSGADNVFIRTTSSGIIPNTGGGRTGGHGYIGTSSWYFQYGYIQNMYVNKLNLSSTPGTENGDIWIS